MQDFTKLYRMDLPHRAISVYIYLADRANKDGICWPSIPKRRTDSSRQTGSVSQNQICQRKHDIEFGALLFKPSVSCFSET